MKIYAVDVQDHKAVDKAVQQAISDLGQIDILINNVNLPSLIKKHLLSHSTGRPCSRSTR